MRHLLFFSSLFFLSSCYNNKSAQRFALTVYQPVGTGYQYSKDILQWNGKLYRPLVTSEYNDDTLTGVAVHKPEGNVEYTRQDLQRDTLLRQWLHISLTRQISIGKVSLTENGREFIMNNRNYDSIFLLRNDTLLVYHLK